MVAGMGGTRARILLTAVMAGALTLGCTDGGVFEPLPEAPSFHFLEWDATNGPVSFNATGETPHGSLDFIDGPLRLAADSIGLDTYEVRFWAVRGEQRTVQINYTDATGAAESPYVRFAVSDPVSRPDGSPIALGDSILLTVSVNPTDIVVHLEPSGLTFGTPAELQMWYGGAKDDLNGDGTVDGTDESIQNNQLGMAWTEDIGQPWDTHPAEHDVPSEWFKAHLEHFSGYAISW